MGDVLTDWISRLNQDFNEHRDQQDKANNDLSSMTFVLFLWTMAMHRVPAKKALLLLKEFEADLERLQKLGDEVPDEEMFTDEAEDRVYTQMLEGIAARIGGAA